MESRLNQRDLNRYLKRRQSGGRGAFARIVDAMGLRIVLFAGAYLFLRPRTTDALPALIMSATFLGLCMIVMRIWREIGTERFAKREYARIRKVLLNDRLLLMNERKLGALAKELCNDGETFVLIGSVKPADADALLTAVRRYGADKRLCVCALNGFDPSAESAAMRMYERIRLSDAAALYKAVAVAAPVTERDIEGYIAAELAADRRRRAQFRALRMDPNGAKRYLWTAVSLIVLSFFTRYALYCRLLAGLCLSLMSLAYFTRSQRDAA